MKDSNKFAYTEESSKGLKITKKNNKQNKDKDEDKNSK